MKKILGVVLCLALAACGGGGGDGASSSPTTVPPTAGTPSQPNTPSTPVVDPTAPKITLSFENPKVVVGDTATLTWAATDASTCEASGGWTGTQALTGASAFSASTPGKTPFTLTCQNSAGKSSTETAYLMVALPVEKTSYQNKVKAAEVLGPQKLPDEVGQGNAVAFADFFQEGEYSMVTHTLEYTYNDPATQNKFGHIHFWKLENQAWVDRTADILTNNTGCLHPRKAVVADFNADGKPDVFFACHGYDSTPFPGEQPHVLMSQADGKYKNVTVPTTCFCHGASAADFDGNGYADVLVTDNMTHGRPYLLTNDKNGSFAEDVTPFASIPFNSAIFTAELIDFDSNNTIDAFIGGDEANGWMPTVYSNNGSKAFSVSKVLPADSSYSTTLDIVFKNNVAYLNRVKINPGNTYGFSEIQKVDYAANTASKLYSNTANFTPSLTWMNWIIPHNGKIESMNSDYGVSVAQ